MTNIYNFIINKPLGWLLNQLSILVGNDFAMAIILFTILVNVLLVPLNIKTQKSTAKQAKLKPRLDVIKKKCGTDKAKYQTEMRQLYADENVSMAGGCLPTVVRLLVMIGVYTVIRSPLTYLSGISSTVVTAAREACLPLTGKAALKSVTQLDVISHIDSLKESFPQIFQKAGDLNFNLFGIDLTQSPTFSLNIFKGFEAIWIIPIFAFSAAMLTSIITVITQKKVNPDAPNTSAIMLSMPLMSLFIAFTVPGAVGFYWGCSSLISGLIQFAMQLLYSPARLISTDYSKAVLVRYKDEQARIKKHSLGETK